jgi:hypothetical protein
MSLCPRTVPGLRYQLLRATAHTIYFPCYVKGSCRVAEVFDTNTYAYTEAQFSKLIGYSLCHQGWGSGRGVVVFICAWNCSGIQSRFLRSGDNRETYKSTAWYVSLVHECYSTREQCSLASVLKEKSANSRWIVRFVNYSRQLKERTAKDLGRI